MAEAEADRAELLIGTYSRAGGKGVYRASLAPADARPRERGDAIPAHDDGLLRVPRKGDKPDDAALFADASFGVWANRHRLWYFVQEREDGALLVGRQEGKELSFLGRFTTGGSAPCHAALDADERCLAIANYGSGSLCFYRLDPASGLPVGEPHLFASSGSGPNEERQEGPHAHWVGFSQGGRWLYMVDLGADTIFAFPFDHREGTIGSPIKALVAPPGSGPRHLALHPRLPLAYLVSELASTLTVLRQAEHGHLLPEQTLSTTPGDAPEGSLGGAIALNSAADRLYVTNRGHDSIAVFALGADGAPSLIQHVPSGGASPRMILLLEEEARLVLANEKGDNVTLFRIAEDGRLAPLPAALEVPGPAFLGLADQAT